MSSPTPSVLSRTLRKLEQRSPLDDADRRAFLALPTRTQTVEAAGFVVQEGERADRSCLLLDGYAIRTKLTETGGRQILSIHIAGDFLDLDGALLNIADHSVQTVTRCVMAFIPRTALRELIATRPKLAMAMWVDTLIDGSIFREWIVNIGRRDAHTRIAHLLCEFARRLEVAGLAGPAGYQLPMTQEQLADATGVTAVHVNRVLKRLAAEGLIVRTKREVTIPDWERLRSVAGFNETYLHLDQVPRGSAREASS